jgi:hypothetical protein
MQKLDPAKAEESVLGSGVDVIEQYWRKTVKLYSYDIGSCIVG